MVKPMGMAFKIRIPLASKRPVRGLEVQQKDPFCLCNNLVKGIVHKKIYNWFIFRRDEGVAEDGFSTLSGILAVG